MTWAKRFWSLPWKNGPNTQFKWKLRYSPIQCAYSVIGDALFRPSTHQYWPRDRKLTQSCRCLHWFLGLRANVGKILLQVHTRPVVTEAYIEKMSNKNIEIGFQSVVFHLCQCHYCEMIEARTQRPLFRAKEKRQSTSYSFGFPLSYIQL